MKTKGDVITNIIVRKLYLVPIILIILLLAHGALVGDLPHWALYVTAALIIFVVSFSSYITASEIIDYLENHMCSTVDILIEKKIMEHKKLKEIN